MPAVPTLFLAPSAAEARRAAWQRAVQSGCTSPLNPPVVFTPTAAASIWRELAREGAGRTAGAPRLVRPEDYFARAYAAIARRRFLSGTDRAWVISGLLSHLDAGEKLNRIIKSRDFAATFGGLISRLRRAGLKQFASGEVGDELNALLRRYESRIEELKAFDTEAAPALFAATAARHLAFDWPRVLIVDDLLDPSPVLQIGLQALFQNAQVVLATLVCPGGVDENSALEKALLFWRAQGAVIERVGNFASPATRAAARLLGEGFEAERPANISLTTAHTPWEEMNLIAAQIRAEVEGGARPDEFAVAFADLAAYEATARHAFAAQGVPLDWPRQLSLRNSPLVRALLRAAEGCRDRWNVHELHDLFGDGTLRLHLEDKIFDARRLRNAARAARDFDLDDIERTLGTFESKIGRMASEGKRDESRERAAIEASLEAGDLEMVAYFRELCIAPISRVTAVEWQTKLLLLVDAVAGHWLEGQSEAAVTAQGAIALLQAAIERVVERARGWSDEEGEGDDRPASEWLRWLNLEIDAPTFTPTERGGVRVGTAGAPPEAARRLYLCGLTEEAWPARRAGSSLGEGGRGIEAELRAHETEPAARAAHVLAHCFVSRSLSLSHPRFVGGKEKSSSTVLDDLKAAWPGEAHGPWPSLPPLEFVSDGSRRGYLASLNRWMASPGDADVESSATHLRTLATMRAQRLEVQPGIYDGVLGERGRDLMTRWRELQRSDSLSVSALERYAGCPLRYFFERVLEIEVDEPLEDDLDSRSAGNLVHAIAHRFLQAWQSPLSADDFEPALQAMGEICWRECQKLQLRPILREAEYHRLMGADARSGPLVKWLKLEIGLGNGAWPLEMRPLRHTANQIEGVTDGLEHRFKVQIGKQEINGIIDRLAVSPDGSQMAVIDYKTGSISNLPTWKTGDDGLHFQLPIYALAARELTRERDAAPRLSMAYLMMRSAKIARGIGQEGTLGKGCSGAKNLPDDHFEAWLRDVEERVGRIAELRNSGTFNISLQSSTAAKCDSCAVKGLCGQRAQTQTLRLEQLEGSSSVYAPPLRKWED
jgi:hypothetical protein